MKSYFKLKLFSTILVLLIMLGLTSLYCLSGIVHAGGTGWSVVPSPNASLNGNSLQSVTALSTDKVWAVGYSVQGTTKRTLIERYNGTSWQIAAAPNVSTGDNVLTGVAAISEKNVWAVGSSPMGALIERYDGTVWRIVSAPTTCQLNAVTAISANDVWAVGTISYQSCSEHFNGTSWRLVSTPKMGTSDNTLLGVSASSSHNVWAVGTYCTGYGCDRGGGSFRTLVLHYTGSGWSSVPSPNPASYENGLKAVTVISATNIWAVGKSNTNPFASSTLIVHFDGVRWTKVASPGMNGSGLTAIAAASATNIFAIGFIFATNPAPATLIEHFNGMTWSIVSSPSTGANPELQGLTRVSGAASGAAQFWAVGSTNTTGSTLTERDIYSGCQKY